MPNLIVSAVSTFDNRGLKKGQKEIGAFDKTLKTLGKTFAGVFGAQKLLSFSKNAVKAFMADEKAAKSLEIQLQNTGNAFAIPSVEYYIANLQKVTGVLDDQLRPAFQQLLTVTGSITKSQDALNTALNVSAATGRSLTEVSAALTRGFSGNTAGLSRLGAGISKATLKTGDMDKILGELNNKFAGQAQARLTTYAGKMDLLTVSAENFKEEIGKGILDALSALGKDKSIENATTQMDNFGKSIGDAIYGTGLLITKLNGLVSKAGGGGLADLLLRLQPGGMQASRAFNFLSSTGAAERNKSSSNFTYSLGSSATRDIERAKEVLRLKASNKLRQDEINKMKAKTEVDKLEEKFNVERIGLMKALAEATDAETKLRIQAKIAILDNNEALAKKYNAELEASNSARALAESAKNAADALNTMPNKFDQIFKNVYEQLIAAGSSVAGARSGAGSSSRYAAEAEDFFAGKGKYAPDLNPTYTPGTNQTNQGTTNIDVTVNTGAVLTSEQDLSVYIQNALGNITKLGNGALVPAGSIAFQ